MTIPEARKKLSEFLISNKGDPKARYELTLTPEQTVGLGGGLYHEVAGMITFLSGKSELTEDEWSVVNSLLLRISL